MKVPFILSCLSDHIQGSAGYESLREPFGGHHLGRELCSPTPFVGIRSLSSWFLLSGHPILVGVA